MSNQFNNIKTMNGFTWEEAIDNAKDFGLDLTYTYDVGFGTTPIFGYPGPDLYVTECLDPGDNSTYPYKIVGLGANYEEEYSNVSIKVRDENGTQVTLYGNQMLFIYALFAENKKTDSWTLVKTTDVIDIDKYDYIWSRVLRGSGSIK